MLAHQSTKGLDVGHWSCVEYKGLKCMNMEAATSIRPHQCLPQYAMKLCLNYQPAILYKRHLLVAKHLRTQAGTAQLH